jgi:hypothetical protein
MAHNPRPETATALVIKAEMLHARGCSGPVWWAGIDGFVNLEDSDIPNPIGGGFYPQWFDEAEAREIADTYGVPLEFR